MKSNTSITSQCKNVAKTNYYPQGFIFLTFNLYFQTWVEEDQQNREEVIASMERMRDQRRTNYSSEGESDAPIFFHTTASDMDLSITENSFA
jgi:hypothetical protein